MDKVDFQAMLRAAEKLPSATAAKRLVNICALYFPTGNTSSSGAKFQVAIPSNPILNNYDPVNKILTVNQINIGSLFRIRALSNGVSFELLGKDNVWHQVNGYQQ